MNYRTRIALLVAGALLVAACGPKQVRGEAPFVQVTSWSIDGRQLSMATRIRNVNDEELSLSGLRFTVMLDEVELLSYQGEHVIAVAANGFETLNLTATASDDGTDLLNRLQTGELKSLPFDFSGAVINADGKSLRFQRDGHIYTVPGRPGQFR
jgi:hypothetical protein